LQSNIKEIIEAMEMRRKMIIKEKVKNRSYKSYKDNEDGISFIKIILPKFRIPLSKCAASYILQLRKGDANHRARK
jgi:hypothetical protein